MTFTFEIVGEPQGKGRPRFSTRGGFVKTYTPEKTASYENFVKLCYLNKYKGQKLDGEIIAEIIAYFMPKQTGPTKEQVETETHCVIENLIRLKSMTDGGFDGNIMRFTKDIIAKVKEKYPDTENSVIAAAVKSYR